jgi:hypothetical protein
VDVASVTVFRGAIYLLGYFVVVFFGVYMVNYVLSKLEMSEEQKASLAGIKGGGKMIGIVERVLTTTFIYLNTPTAIAIVLAAKSIIRFESAKERAFAEYYLVGTLTSITFALLIGALCSYGATLIT